ncbi:hypothetical protein Pcac1_g6696 [Phytophthora cactorum]|uniref:Uncharacterized protein n=2 Tax=Phytophthora cactorum TaxID=29920 RepID=A0A8T1B5Q2_9STRA|nr:hypothetical protein Pcac1_g6696 [Phytophthora cactorum]KAG2879525.1 hypothetical protein PC114_g22533 [Phytophthora cactorum]KAG2895455.1 hypothetical protein PC117_g23247 [Phytophthora cactorum]KAG2991504.1 hypothetical protein PC120_g22687 [Phytophthora cactorum]KAG3058725.1 hypothetical protein PC122_g20595 [Phytophthora cactorum]
MPAGMMGETWQTCDVDSKTRGRNYHEAAASQVFTDYSATRFRRIQCSRSTGEWSVAIVKAYPTDIFDGNDRTRPNDPQEGGGDGSSSDDPLSDR